MDDQTDPITLTDEEAELLAAFRRLKGRQAVAVRAVAGALAGDLQTFQDRPLSPADLDQLRNLTTRDGLTFVDLQTWTAVQSRRRPKP